MCAPSKVCCYTLLCILFVPCLSAFIYTCLDVITCTIQPFVKWTVCVCMYLSSEQYVCVCICQVNSMCVYVILCVCTRHTAYYYYPVHMHRGNLISPSICVSVITTKIATSLNIGVWTTCKCKQSVEIGKKVAWMRLSTVDEHDKQCLVCCPSWPHPWVMPSAGHLLSAVAHKLVW